MCLYLINRISFDLERLHVSFPMLFPSFFDKSFHFSLVLYIISISDFHSLMLPEGCNNIERFFPVGYGEYVYKTYDDSTKAKRGML